ncbi:glycosyltransferase [uncultured Gilvimarinus sp.]|uniref:glycosyltransferase n=1 Tax=uncultured Gilvimarinus sp. TaxID=1689143 RepID=UPI0030EE407A
MDLLLQKAADLANSRDTGYLPIAGRVAYVVSHGQSYASNGYAVRTQGIARALNQHGLETLCFVKQGRPWDIGAADDAVSPEMCVDGVRYIHSRWPDGIRPDSELVQLETAARQLEESFHIYRPEAVVAASNYMCGLPAWVAATRLNIPFYNEVRGFWELSKAAREPGYELSPEFKQESVRDAFVARRAAAVFTLNAPMRQELARRGVEEDKIYVVPNGIDRLPSLGDGNPELAESVGIEPNDKVVGYVGSRNSYEGLATLIEACAQLVGNGVKLKLLLVGDDQAVTCALAKNSVAAEGVDDMPWVIHVGRVPHEHISDYYALIDVIVIPRKDSPVCQLVPPIKAVEALGYRKNVVLSNVAPLRPYAEAFPSATLFDSASSDALAEAIKKSLSGTGIEPRVDNLKSLEFFYTATQMHQVLAGNAPEVESYESGQLARLSNLVSQEAVTKSSQSLAINVAGSSDSEFIPTEITRAPLWFDFPVDELVPHDVSGTLTFAERSDLSKRACIARIEYRDQDGNTLPGPYSGLAVSEQVGAFSYLNVTGDALLQIVPPLGARRVCLGIQCWNARNGVTLNTVIQCKSQIPSVAGGLSSTADIKQHNAKRSNAPTRDLKHLKVAAILDEFTMECFRHEVALTALSPTNWEEELEAAEPDLLFVESCWFGNANQWSGLIYGYNSNGPNKMNQLIEVVAHCRKNGIPTVFWAKEDPVHYKRFGPTAKLFDYVYTTDANMVSSYQKDFGIEAEPLSFFCQPRVHNPTSLITRNNKAAFAGSYYSDKIERCENFHSIMRGLEQAGVGYDIYDRCLKRGVAHLQFPEHFKQHVVGYLEPHEMWKAYKGYRYTVNLNTVKHSPTMFARRVYESLASGTPVISNYSEGVITQFGGIVCASDNPQDVVDYLNRLGDSSEYQAISERGVRETLGHHTLADRLEQVCERLGIPVIPHLPIANAVYTAGTEAEVEQARAHFQEQDYHHKRLVVNLENSNVLYPYLNQNNEEEIFRVLTEFAKPLEGIEVPMTLDARCPATLLEDEAIKTQYQVGAEPVQFGETGV